MKLIIAIIQPHKLEAVKRELEAVEVNLMTVTNVVGQGRQKGVTEIYRGAKEAGGLLNKVRLDIAVNEDFVEPTIDAITKGAHTGSVGDGKIFVVDLAECIRISTGERGGWPSGEVVIMDNDKTYARENALERCVSDCEKTVIIHALRRTKGDHHGGSADAGNNKTRFGRQDP